jgi:hypothetical protein
MTVIDNVEDALKVVDASVHIATNGSSAMDHAARSLACEVRRMRRELQEVGAIALQRGIELQRLRIEVNAVAEQCSELAATLLLVCTK